MIYCSKSSIEHHCGTVEIGGFILNTPQSYERLPEEWAERMKHGRESAAICTFINDNVCKEAYKEMCIHFKLVSQTPIMKNPKTNREYILCVFQPK